MHRWREARDNKSFRRSQEKERSRRSATTSRSRVAPNPFCIEVLEAALAQHGRPEIFNTDQGSQFTGAAFTGVLAKHEIAISMDGKGASMRSMASP